MREEKRLDYSAQLRCHNSQTEVEWAEADINYRD